MTEQVNTPRRVHLVGTWDGTTTQETLDSQVALLGDDVDSVADEHTRPNWVIELVEARADNPRLATRRRSRMSKPRPLRPLWDPPRYTVLGRDPLTTDDLNLPYYTDAMYMMKVFDRIVTATHPRIRPQFGIPGPADVAAFAWLNPFTHYDLEARAAAEQVTAIHELTKGTALFQLEIPLETVAVVRSPARLRPRVAGWWARMLCDFIQLTPEGSEWIVHLCRGNKHDTALVSPRNCAGEVELANALGFAWPHATHPLNGMHVPFGDRTNPAPYLRGYYDPCSDLELPESVGVLAGLVRPEMTMGHHRWALDTCEQAVGRRVGVSTPCGTRRQGDVARVTAGLLAGLART